jgi:tRNA (guanine37-N1)-methyltransferase
MKFHFLSIFPEIFETLNYSLIGKAQEKELVQIAAINLRDFATGGHKSVDDAPYGGGAGMVMSAPVWGDAIDQTLSQINQSEQNLTALIMLTPAGEKFNQSMAKELANYDHLIFACGRYEGIDQRVYDYYRSQENENFKVREVSIGDYVLNGGEVAALVMVEAIARLTPGVIGNEESLQEESHSFADAANLLEYPAYTRPASWRGLVVPEVLLSGNHQAIAEYRLNESRARTNARKKPVVEN